MKKLPKIIKKVGFDFDWDEKKVWDLDLPVETINIEELEWHFDIPFWSTQKGHYNLKPNKVLKSPNEHKDHFDRIMKSNLSHPLDIMFWKNRWLLLDGLHRLVKAKQLGWKVVKVRKIPLNFIPLIKK